MSSIQEVQTFCNECETFHKDFKLHYRSAHHYSNICLLCQDIFTSANATLNHLKILHGHCLGLLPPPTDLREEVRAQRKEINRESLNECYRNLKLPRPEDGRSRLLNNGHYITLYDDIDQCPLLAFELLNETTVPNKPKFEPNHKISYYQNDSELPKTQITRDVLVSMINDASHLACAANHTSSEDEYRSTFTGRNIVPLLGSLNKGINSSIDDFLRTVARNWDLALITIPIYKKDKINKYLGWETKEVSHLVKIGILSETEMQVWAFANELPEDDGVNKPHNLVYFRSDLETVHELPGFRGSFGSFKFTFSQKLSWEIYGLWKCGPTKISKEFCRFTTNDRLTLKIHQWQHEGINYCGGCRTNNRRSDLSKSEHDKHVRSHKLHHCDQCDSFFFQYYQLKEHLISHSPEKSFSCEICGSGFKFDRSVLHHMRLVHSDASDDYKCSICNQEFLRKASLQSHMRRKHKNASSDSQETNTAVTIKNAWKRNRSISMDEIFDSVSVNSSIEDLDRLSGKIKQRKTELLAKANLRQRVPESNFSITLEESEDEEEGEHPGVPSNLNSFYYMGTEGGAGEV